VAIERSSSVFGGIRRSVEIVPSGHRVSTGGRRRIVTRTRGRFSLLIVDNHVTVSLEDGIVGKPGGEQAVPLEILRGDEVTQESPVVLRGPFGILRRETYSYRPESKDPQLNIPKHSIFEQ
jgi:hypothetical protein